MYAFKIFFSALSPQGVDHGKDEKLSLDENFLIFFPKISSHYPIGEFGGRIRHGNKNFFSLPLIAEKSEVWHPLFFIFLMTFFERFLSLSLCRIFSEFSRYIFKKTFNKA